MLISHLYATDDGWILTQLLFCVWLLCSDSLRWALGSSVLQVDFSALLSSEQSKAELEQVWEQQGIISSHGQFMLWQVSILSQIKD